MSFGETVASVSYGCRLAGVFLLATLALGAVAYLRQAPSDARLLRFFVSPPEGSSLALTLSAVGGASLAPLAVSPDGRRLAFIARGADGKPLLWIRALDTLTAQLLAGTDGASSPFWSPDSRFLGFFADGKLKKIEVSGGPPVTLCDAAIVFWRDVEPGWRDRLLARRRRRCRRYPRRAACPRRLRRERRARLNGGRASSQMAGTFCTE